MNAAARHVAVLGGGLAGMSAAAALAEEGYRVTLLEKRPTLGGRAGSYLDPITGDWVDNCQHVLMPCCTNLLDFYRRMGVHERIRFYSEIPFIDRSGNISTLRSSPLPAPLHCAPAFLRLKFLSPSDKLRIAWGLAALLCNRGDNQLQGTARDWFLAHGQSDRTLQKFWQLILVSALNEDLDRASSRYAAKVFLDAFLSNSKGWWLGIPTVPLNALYAEPFVRLLARRNGQVRLHAEARNLAAQQNRVAEIVLSDGERIEADIVVVALPWRAAFALLPREAFPRASAVLPGEKLNPSPITGVHLWFDRPVTDLDFAALPGRQMQWFFNKTRVRAGEALPACYLQLVTSASRSWIDLTKSQILEIVLKELAEVLPETRTARICRSYVLKEPLATFSPTPDSDGSRPLPETEIPNLFLAGDWIQTGWPATMEGAVRSGYLAAEVVLRADGKIKKLLVPDLPPSGLMRFLGFDSR